MDNLSVRGQEAEVHGLAPNKTIDLDMYQGQHIPRDWDIVGVTGDIILAEYADEDDSGDDLVNRGGVLISASATRAMWRIVKVIMAGPGVPEDYREGAYLMIPNDRGLPMTKFDGKNMIFINAERVFCIVKPKKKKE